MEVEMDTEFAAALRGMLVEHVEAPPSRHRLPRRPRVMVLRLAILALVLAGGGGVAAATGVLSLWPPGSPVITPLSVPVTVTGDGTQTIDLGRQPQNANAIDLSFRCLTSGTFTFGDGSGAACSQADVGSSPVTATLALSADQHTTTITAAAGQRWSATLFYADSSFSPWKTNANGQTYGAINKNGTPDLVAVIATNGQSGYVYADELNPPPPTSPAAALAEQAANTKGVFIPVYDSDGKTVIGRFEAAEPGAVP